MPWGDADPLYVMGTQMRSPQPLDLGSYGQAGIGSPNANIMVRGISGNDPSAFNSVDAQADISAQITDALRLIARGFGYNEDHGVYRVQGGNAELGAALGPLHAALGRGTNKFATDGYSGAQPFTRATVGADVPIGKDGALTLDYSRSDQPGSANINASFDDNGFGASVNYNPSQRAFMAMLGYRTQF